MIVFLPRAAVPSWNARLDELRRAGRDEWALGVLRDAGERRPWVCTTALWLALRHVSHETDRGMDSTRGG